MLTLILTALLAAASPSPSPSPSGEATGSPGSPSPSGPVILFLVDNSASLPPLDPDEKRVAALEKIFTFLKGQPYRVVLFGGRREIFVDDITHYNNRGQWTDFYAAFEKGREIIQSYPAGTDFRMIMITDAILDPGPADWEVPEGQELKAYVRGKTLALLAEMKLPLYVILVGDVPKDGVAPRDPEQSPTLVLEMIRTANGKAASPTAQSLASFFKDDGVLLKKFVFRVAPAEGLKRIEPVIRRIIAPSRPRVEFGFLSALILPLTLFVCLLLGILVRSFPGPGDTEVLELPMDDPVHVAADKLHRLDTGAWGATGLSLVGDTRDAVATVRFQRPALDISGAGLDTTGLDAMTAQLLPLDVEELGRNLDRLSHDGSKDEKIYALNLDYIAKNFDPVQAERILTRPPHERGSVPPMEFLRAKTHLLNNPDLRKKLTEARVNLVTYGAGGERKDIFPGSVVKLGPYRFMVKEVSRGGRKEARLVLYYDRIPSALKTILPDGFQRMVRLRSSAQRIVS